MRSRQARRPQPRSRTATTVLLFLGAGILLLASGGIIGFAARDARPGATPTAIAVAGPARPSTAVPTAPQTLAPTVSATTPSRAVAAGTPAPAATVAPTSAPTPTAAAPSSPAPTLTAPPATPRPPSPTPTPQRPLGTFGGCTMTLPAEFREEGSGTGYFPAVDRTGFAALDQFDTQGGRRSLEDLTADFAKATISRTLRDYRQTAAARSGDGYRIEYTATTGNRPGKGSFYLKSFGPTACGVTIFLLDGSPVGGTAAMNVMILSLDYAPPGKSATPAATPQR